MTYNGICYSVNLSLAAIGATMYFVHAVGVHIGTVAVDYAIIIATDLILAELDAVAAAV